MVKRTNLNLDMDLVDQAARELGTVRTTDTVHEALREVIAMRPAAAEAAGVTVLHHDEDYDRIAAITRQPTRWIAPQGS